MRSILRALPSALALAALFLLGVARAQPSETYPLPGDEVYPEGVAYAPSSGEFYVGSTSDGTVFRGEVGGPGVEAEVFLEGGSDGRSTAIGMAVDEGTGRLFVAGGDTGRMSVYDLGTGDPIESLRTDADPTFVNDVALTPDGSAFFTDSMSPRLYRLLPEEDGGYTLETYLEFEGTPVEYADGFNLNGIESTPDGRYLIVVQSNTGKLFRIDTQDRGVEEIDAGGAELGSGDGLALEGSTLFVVRNSEDLIVPLELSDDLTGAEAREPFTDDALDYPTTIALYDGRLLAVNSQFGARESGEGPDLPFTVAGVPIPERALPESGGPPWVVLLPALGLALLAAGALLRVRTLRRGAYRS